MGRKRAKKKFLYCSARNWERYQRQDRRAMNTHTTQAHIGLDDPKCYIAEGRELSPEIFPEIGHISAAFFFRFMPRPVTPLPPEYVYVPFDGSAEMTGVIGMWNMAWEAGHLRHQVLPERLPSELHWLKRYSDHNINLLSQGKHHYDAYAPLFHLLPARILKRFGL